MGGLPLVGDFEFGSTVGGTRVGSLVGDVAVAPGVGVALGLSPEQPLAISANVVASMTFATQCIAPSTAPERTSSHCTLATATR